MSTDCRFVLTQIKAAARDLRHPVPIPSAKDQTMKSLLAILTDMTQTKGLLAGAAAFARAHDAHLDVLAMGVDSTPVSYGQFGTSIAIIQVAVERAEALATEISDAARAALTAEGPGLRWAVDAQMAQSGGIVELAGFYARLADLVILPQPYGAHRSIDAEIVLESALFDGRAPVLVLPETGLGKAATPQTVVVAWNQSAEAMAAIRAALPLLKAAKNVSLAVIDPASHGAERSDPGGMLSQMLARHGVHADVAVLARTMPRVSDVLNRHIIDTGADLLVMGAYGHSRLREALFGGATREMLESCPVPMLMAH
jgi:nucleotide-binding universal stress UspA family protein